MSVTEAQCRRAVKHIDVPWDPTVTDPRDPRWVVHAHHGILGGLAGAFAAGRKTLRRAEDFIRDAGSAARRVLGLNGTPVDSTLYRVVSKQCPKGLAETVWAQIKDFIARKVIKNDFLKRVRGVMTFDGKGTWSSTDTEVEGAKQSSCDAAGSPLQMFGALRAVLTSSLVRPCVAQQIIGSKEGESPAFRELFPKVCQELGGHFQIVTADAGLCARENAELVREHDKWYVFGLKGNQPRLHQLARNHFFAHDGKQEVLARTEERVQGKTLVREHFAWSVKGNLEVDLRDAEQFWYVRQTTIEDNGSWNMEQRYFAVAIPAGELTPDEELAVVRMHWGIENGHNWTMDMMLWEDDAKPCQASKESIEVVSWLRIIGYNIASAWRAQEPKKDRKPMPWERAMETLRDAVMLAAPREVVPAST